MKGGKEGLGMNSKNCKLFIFSYICPYREKFPQFSFPLLSNIPADKQKVIL
jgi:hypothetical protein